jgi:hypothetical protein
MLLLLLTVVAAVLAARWLLLGDDAIGGATARHDEVPSSASGDAAGGPDGDERSRSSAGATRKNDLPAPVVASGARSLPTLDWKLGPSSGFPVHVVDANTRKPIPGAHVAVVAAAPNEVRSRFDDLAPRVAADAPGFLADSHGWARVEWPPVPAYVVGESGELHGARQLEATGREPFELELSRRRELRVEVVDRRGAPIPGARVTWAGRAEDGRIGTSSFTRSADDRGQATLDQEEGEQWLASLADAARGLLGVAVLWVGSDDAEAASFTALPVDAATPLRCVVSADFGAIEVRVFDRFGRRIVEDARIDCTRLPREPDDGRGGVTFIHRGRVPFELAPPSDRRGLLAPVAIGERFRILGEIPSGEGVFTDVTGPQQTGETVRAELRSPIGSVRLHGRLVGVKSPASVIATIGQPVERPWLDGSSGMHGFVARWAVGGGRPVVHLGANGAFEIEPIGLARTVEVPIAFLGLDGERGEPFVGEAPLPADLSSADVDLGDVAVHPIPLIVSGRVLTPDRQPVTGADVWVEGTIGNVPTDASGRFLVVGAVSPTHRKLRALAPGGSATATVEFEDGTRDLDVVLQPYGALAGRLLSERSLALFARPHGGGEAVAESEGRSPGPGFGASPFDPPHVIPARFEEPRSNVERPFRFELLPGRYDVIVSLGGMAPEAERVALVPDVEVVANRTSCDPRLDPLDLQGVLGRWHITLSRSDGAAPPSTWVRLADVDHGDDFLQTLYVSDAGAGIDSALASAWVDVSHPGFRHVHELHERGEVKLVLEPVASHPFVVHVAAPTLPRAAGIEWRVRAEPSWTPPVDGLDWFTAIADHDGDAVLDLDEGESWRIHLIAAMKHDDREPRFEIAHLTRPLDARDLEKGSIELRPEVDDVDAALAAIDLKH